VVRDQVRAQFDEPIRKKLAVVRARAVVQKALAHAVPVEAAGARVGVVQRHIRPPKEVERTYDRPTRLNTPPFSAKKPSPPWLREGEVQMVAKASWSLKWRESALNPGLFKMRR
jgi:hypothetical protein